LFLAGPKGGLNGDEQMSDSLMQTYTRHPVAFVRGEGVWLWDSEGKRYLDALSGIAVCGLGHCHPRVTAAIQEQAQTLVHTSNVYRIPHQERLGERLCAHSGMQTAFFCNSGTEANEAAIKLARLYGHNRGIANPTIIVTEGSFHGRTLAALSATGNTKIQAGFEPLVSGFHRVPYDDLAAVRAAEGNGDIVAVLVEPVTGEGGVVVPSEGYLRGLREICDRNGWLLMVDEIQTGMGRTGRWFAFQHEGVRPDVLSLAKGLGNGFPIGACLAAGPAARLFQAGNHGSTFGGNPLACRTGLAVVETLEAEDLPTRAAQQGARLQQALREGLAGLAGVRQVRGLGLMIGVELDRPCGELVGRALTQGLLINVTAGSVVRLLPPLIVSDADVDLIAEQVVALVRGFLNEQSAAQTAGD
jgi:acetylornithine/N-succinyldiaminopimelate aminotransferase